MNKKRSLIGGWMLVVLWAVSFPVYTQNQIYETFGKNHGLRGHTFFHCYQDGKQRLWVASDYGVALLDGHDFKSLAVERGMPETAILRIAEDSLGYLWFMTMNGIPARFDGQEVTTHWGKAFEKNLRGANYISSYAAVKDGSMVFGTHDGRAFQIFPDGKHRLFFSEKWGGVQLIDVEEEGGITFHFTTVNAIAHWKENKLTYIPMRQYLEDWDYGTLRTTKLRDGRFVYGVENRIAIVQVSGDTLRKIHQVSIPEKNIVYIGQDWRGNLWVGTNDGAVKYSVQDSLLQFPARFMTGHVVSSVCRDHEDGLWFTSGGGLHHCRNENIYTSKPRKCESPDEASTIFASRDGNIYLGFESGKIQKISRKSLEVVAEFPNTSNVLTPKIQKFLDGPDGAVMVAADGGLMRLKQGKKEVLATTKLADFSLHGQEACACLFSGWTRIHLDEDGKWLDSVSSKFLKAQATVSDRCLHCAYDQSGTLWVTTFADILRIRGSQVDTIPIQDLSDAGYKNSFLQAISGNRLAFGTSGQGLFIFTPEGSHHLGKNNGLADNHIIGLSEDAKGHGWVLTSRSVSKLDITSSPPKVLRSISRSDLFGGFEVHDHFILNDTFWAAAGDGFVVFPVSIAETNQRFPSVKMSNLWVNNVKRPLEQPVKLSHQENNLHLEFKAATFTDPQLVEYQYRVVGFNDSFQTTTSQSIDLLGLSPDAYQVEIQARHPFGKWGDKTVFTFEISPPFWERPWFFALEGIALSAAIFLGLWVTIRNIRKKTANREALVEAKHNALISQMNPHFVFNSLNSIQNFVLTREIETANDYLADFAALMRAILVNARATFITIADETKFIRLYLRLESLRLDGGFDYTIHVSSEIAPNVQVIPTMMLQPLLENAIWHGLAPLDGRKGELTVEITQRQGYLECLVADNGIGRKVATERREKFGKKHQSLASTIMQERIELMNRNLKQRIRMEVTDREDANGKGMGTEVKLLIPLNLAMEKLV